jgi:glucosamine--fructose-6-phosphate aminotransferase (isomerizing)
MCGIVGYIGKGDAVAVGLDCLKRLEYRGYDSAGIAFYDPEKASVRSYKTVQGVLALMKKAGNPEGSHTAICHTRWATHGGVSEENAHPHTDCNGNIWVIHNGIIENHKELKEWLVARGHTFISETDTEVVPHLIEEVQKELAEKGEDASFTKAVQGALARLKGAYGFAMMDRREPSVLIGARNFSPLLLGVVDGGGLAQGYILASDATAILKHTNRVIYLDDGDMVVLTPHGHEIYDVGKNLRNPDTHTIEWTPEEAEKGGHPHFMFKEMMEEPEAVTNAIRGRLVPSEGLAKLGGLAGVEEQLRKAKRLFIVGCGTSYHSGKIGEYMLEEYAGISTEVDIASEFRYRKPLFAEGDVVLAISQSGETADTAGAIREAKEKGVLTLGIVNAVGSSIARDTDAGVYEHIGPEIGVGSTKAFTAQVAIMALLTLHFGRMREMSQATGKRIAEELQRIPSQIDHILKTQTDEVRRIAEKYRDAKNFMYLGRKYNVGTALEGALKLKELSYVHAEGIPAGEIKHGPIAMIEEDFPSVVIAPHDSVYEKMASTIAEIKARKGKVIAIATEGDNEIQKHADDVLYIPKTLEMLTPILAVIPLQLFAYYFGVGRGINVDRPRNLAKSVTVE